MAIRRLSLKKREREGPLAIYIRMGLAVPLEGGTTSLASREGGKTSLISREKKKRGGPEGRTYYKKERILW